MRLNIEVTSEQALQNVKKRNLLGSSTKVEKGEKKGFMTAILYLAASIASGYNVCSMASKGCIFSCLGHSSGHMRFEGVQTSQIWKTIAFFEHREAFFAKLIKNITSHVRKAKKEGLTPTVRLNGTSDIMWEKISFTHQGTKYANIFELFPDVQFYDYTKIPFRGLKVALPNNYHLTFSRSESNDAHVDIAIKRGFNVAVVFETMPKIYKGLPVIDGDETDLRFLDPTGCIVGLTAKGDARKDTSGFVVRSTVDPVEEPTVKPTVKPEKWITQGPILRKDIEKALSNAA